MDIDDQGELCAPRLHVNEFTFLITFWPLIHSKQGSKVFIWLWSTVLAYCFSSTLTGSFFCRPLFQVHNLLVHASLAFSFITKSKTQYKSITKWLQCPIAEALQLHSASRTSAVCFASIIQTTYCLSTWNDAKKLALTQ